MTISINRTDYSLKTSYFYSEDFSYRAFLDGKIDANQLPDPKFGPIGKEVYERTYSRDIYKVDPATGVVITDAFGTPVLQDWWVWDRPADDRIKELWGDSCRRIVQGTLSLAPSQTKEGEDIELFKALYEFKMIPAGRHLWTTGTPSPFNRNCWSAPVGKKTSDHFHFTASRLFEGGGVGSNYSTDLWEQTENIIGNVDVMIACNPDHADYAKVREAAGTHYVEGVAEFPDYTVYEVHDSREGWADCWSDLVDMSMIQGDHKVIIDVSKIRKYGAPLRTFGGQASGPEPLVEAVIAIAAVLNGAYGRKLNGLEAMEIDHQIAKSVVAGGTRRSARLALMRWNDPMIDEFLVCKQDLSQHWTSNISVEVDSEFRKALSDETHPEYELANHVLNQIAVGMTRDGEPGIVDTEQMSIGENTRIRMTNPCLTGDSLLVTDEGLARYSDLINEGVTESLISTDSRITYEQSADGDEHAENWKIQNGAGTEILRQASEIRMTQPMADIIKVTTVEGFEVRLTPDHHIATPNGMVMAGDLELGDNILITKGSPNASVAGTEPQNAEERMALLMGLIAGDGSFSPHETKQDQALIYLWGEDREEKAEQVKTYIDSLFDEYKDQVKPNSRPFTPYSVNEHNGRLVITSTFLSKLLEQEYNFIRSTKLHVPDRILRKARTREGLFYLAGLFYADGTVNTSKQRENVRLSQSERSLLVDVQRMLVANGIYGRIYSRRPAKMTNLPDGNGGTKPYPTRENFEIVINSDRNVFGQVVGFWNSAKDAKLAAVTSRPYAPVGNHYATVSTVEADGQEPVFCLSEPETRSQVVNGIAMRRCGEAILSFDPGDPENGIPGAGESCNLGSVNMAAYGTDTKGLLDSVRMMARFLYRATLKEHPSEPASRIELQNRRIGVGIFGLQGWCLAHNAKLSELAHREDLKAILVDMRKAARQAADEIADELGTPRSIKVTVLAPTGTTSQLPGETPGISPVMYKYFIRRVRFESNNKKLDEYRAKGYHVEPDVMAANTSVVSFPVMDTILERYADKAHLIEDSTDLSFGQFMELVDTIQNTFCGGEDGQAVSSTAQLPPHADPVMVGTEIKKVLGKVKGVTAFPNLSRPQMPYEKMTEDEYYDAMVNIFDHDENVGDSNDGNCGTGGCPIV